MRLEGPWSCGRGAGTSQADSGITLRGGKEGLLHDLPTFLWGPEKGLWTFWL